MRDRVTIVTGAAAGIGRATVPRHASAGARANGKESRLGSRREPRRYGRPEEVASVIAFPGSDDVSYITGQTLPVEGGNSASLNLPGMKVLTAMIDLTNKVAVITGSSRGIGRAIAEAYAKAGAAVVVSSRKAETCKPVADALCRDGRDAMAVPCHVAAKDQLQNLVDRTIERFGRIDILVCNAAVNPVYGPLSGLPDEAYDKIMLANVKGTLWLCNMAIPQMAKRRTGSVILISSIAGLRGTAQIGAYGMSKAAEAALVRNLAVEWGPRNVRVNAIAPGLIATDFAKALLEDPVRRRRVEERTPLGRVGLPEEIAGVALFLASDLASFVTGQLLIADGGDTIS